MAGALFNEGNTLTDPAAKVAADDEVVSRFADDTEPSVREVVAMALVNRAAS